MWSAVSAPQAETSLGADLARANLSSLTRELGETYTLTLVISLISLICPYTLLVRQVGFLLYLQAAWKGEFRPPDKGCSLEDD